MLQDYSGLIRRWLFITFYFWKPISKNTRHVRDAIELLKKEKVDFDFDEMQPDVALNPIYREIYPFSKIVGNANILIMPALHSALYQQN